MNITTANSTVVVGRCRVYGWGPIELDSIDKAATVSVGMGVAMVGHRSRPKGHVLTLYIVMMAIHGCVAETEGSGGSEPAARSGQFHRFHKEQRSLP
jgi:hypothetical protein